MVALFDVGDALNSDPNKPGGGSDLNSASQSVRAHAQLYQNRIIPNPV